MKIKDILATERPIVSFEVFPPKKDAPFSPVKDAVERLARQHPAFMSVTYGASGNAQANTVEVASFVQSCDVPALAHLTCVAASPVWELYGKRGLVTPDALPSVGDVLGEGGVCFHLRAGKHYLSRTDWLSYLKTLSSIAENDEKE